MQLEQVPPPERVTIELLPLLRILYAALETGILRTVEYFDREEAPIDPSLAPNLVRYHAKRYLDAQESPLIDEVSFERQELSNNGLLVKFGAHQIRILKSDNGRVPVPGASQAKRDYYQQPLPLIAMDDPSTELPPLKLLALWDAAPASYTFLGLSLVLPMAGGEDRSSVQCHWEKAIDETMIAAAAMSASKVNELPVDDLPIALNPVAKSVTVNEGGESA